MRHRIRRPIAVLGTLAVVGSLLTLGGLSGAVAPAASAVTAEPESQRSSFTVPVLPDTQFYSRYSASQFQPKYGTDPFTVQTEWIVEQQEALEVPFVVHVGDVVDQEWVNGEWDAAANAMQVLQDGGVPYSVVPGNHDVRNPGNRSSEADSGQYLGRFGAAKMAEQAAAGDATLLGSSQGGINTAYLFEAEGRQWMSLALAWNASDDALAWAQTILDAHPGVPTILSSHAIVNIGPDQMTPAYWWWGEHLWETLVRGNDQIVISASGHFHGATLQTRTNDAGNDVYQVLTDYQMAADGGNGIMSLFEFDLTNQRIDVETVSPWVGVKDPASRGSSDTPVLDGPWQSFSVDVDFAGRFGYEAEAEHEDGGDLSELAKAIVSEGWDGGDGTTLQAPGGQEDYVRVDGTVAHWRFGEVAEGAVDETTVIPDVAGGSSMHRNALERTDSAEELDDLVVSSEDTPFYSSDGAVSCYTEAYRAEPVDRMSYLTTEYGAPATFADLTAERGYTIETFLQLDADWTETANRWSAAITRGGARQWVGINDSSDATAGASWLGISNLREYQFSAADTGSRDSYTLWSGEIMQSAWHHVAVVADPADDTVIMYVDGVPVLRNASGVGGMVSADYMPWILGASTNNTEADHGWHGCIGETRIVDHALDADEFLTARVDLDTSFAVTSDLGSVLPSDAVVDRLEGTGVAGTSVRVELGGEELASAEVGADGVWVLELDESLAGAGSYALAVTPSFGARDGRAVEAVVVIAERSGWTPEESDLTPETAGLVTVSPSTFTAGDAIELTVPESASGREIVAVAFSTPTLLGSATVSGAGRASLVTPSSLPAGEHRLAVYLEDGDLLGWAPVTVLAAQSPGGGSDDGGSTGGGSVAQPAADADQNDRDGAIAATGAASWTLPLLVAAVAALLLGVVVTELRRRGRRIG